VPTRECGCQMGCREIEPVGRLDDPLPGRRADSWDAAQGARDRTLVDTCFTCHVSYRGTTSGGLGPCRNHPSMGFGEHESNYTAGERFRQPLLLALTRVISTLRL
jgi:hypothetical protein